MDIQKILLSPIRIGPRLCANRFFIQAMEGGDADSCGNPAEPTLRRYEEFFRGEAGLVSLEAITITDKIRSRLNQLSIMPANLAPLTALVARVKAVNPKTLFIFQLTHAGESGNHAFSRRVSIKPLPGDSCETLSEADVARIMDEFVLAARIAHDSGADGIDLKLCHSYLGAQILRPYNDRKWKYGGSWQNRRQFAFDLYERISGAVNDKNFLLGSKISAWEGWPGGFGSPGPDVPGLDLTEPLDLVRGLEERGAHYVIASAGGHASGIFIHPDANHIHLAYLHQTFAKAFRDRLRPDTVVIGSGYSVFGDGQRPLGGARPEQRSVLTMGAATVARGHVDMIGLGRQAFADPLLPRKLREGREDQITFCTACNHCARLLGNQGHTGCSTYNPYYADILAKIREAGPK